METEPKYFPLVSEKSTCKIEDTDQEIEFSTACAQHAQNVPTCWKKQPNKCPYVNINSNNEIIMTGNRYISSSGHGRSE